MFLFLDVVSPIPEFHLINDKKIQNSFKIMQNANQKLSDQIIPRYLEIKKTYNIEKKIKKLIVTIGPGSYTALRVGTSFIAGLSQSMNLPVSTISVETIYDQLYDPNNQIGIYFESSNNQNFFSYKEGSNFYNLKIDNDPYLIPENISLVFFNKNVSNFINTKVKLRAFSIKDTVLRLLDNLKFDDKSIIKPIYISNNKLLN